MVQYGLIFCDAGAANQAMAHLMLKGIKDVNGSFMGPAQSIYKEFFPSAKIFDRIEEVIDTSDLLITGTSWSSDFEHRARILASKRGVPSIAVVDHWVNYISRFEFNGLRQMPDQIWVFDNMAYDIAKLAFSASDVRLKAAGYKEYMLMKISSIPQRPFSFLYLCEPMRQPLVNGLTIEEMQLMTFLDKLEIHKNYCDAEVFIRPHPSEKDTKYDEIINKYRSLDIKMDKCTLAEALSRSGIVVGCSSYALYLAYCAKRKVMSSKIGGVDDHAFNINEVIRIESL